MIVVIMGQNCEKTLEMCLKSVKLAEDVVYCDGGSTDNSKILADKHNAAVISNPFDKSDKAMNGKQRNFYLNYIKKNYPNDWALVLDADEVVENYKELKEFIRTFPDNGVYGFNVKMRHFIGDLGHEDATHETHYVPMRLFKISQAEFYPEHSHPVLQIKGQIANLNVATIWHLGHLPVEYIKYVSNRYQQHKTDSLIHTQEFLRWWRDAHLFGKYPVRLINPREIPKLIYEGLNIDYNEIYSSQEQLEMKHHIMVKQWVDYFKPESVLDLGCGRGCYLYYWQWFVDRTRGIDINKWAVENNYANNVLNADITKFRIDVEYINGREVKADKWDLITAIDILEHLDNEGLNYVLRMMSENGNKFLFSIPFIGDPNLEADKTHIQRKTKEEWISLIESYGIKIKETPNWLFKEQILIGEKK